MSALKKLAPAIAAGVATAGLSIAFAATPAHACLVTGTSEHGTGNDCIANITVSGVGSLEAGARANAAWDPTTYVLAGPNSPQAPVEAYVVATDHSANDLGYIGISNYENGNDIDGCRQPIGPDGDEGGTLTNSGGCYGGDRTWVDLRGGPLLVVDGTVILNTQADIAELVPLLVSGDDTGPFGDSTRDGARHSALNGLDAGLTFLDDFCDLTSDAIGPPCPVT